MVDLSSLKAKDLQGLSPSAVAELATRMLAELKVRTEQAERDARTIRFKDAKLEKITFELARLKAWKFGAHTERLNAEQRQMFETTAAEDEADLAAQLAALQGQDKPADGAPPAKPKTQPRRKPLPKYIVAEARPPSQGRQIAPAEAVMSWSWSVRMYLPRI